MNALRLPTLSLLFWTLLAGIELPSAELRARTLLEAGSATVWKYLDAGPEPDVTWSQLGYDDTGWKSGRAPLGFGEVRLATQVNSGPDQQHRPITTWFRREFEAPTLKSEESLVLAVCVDDGAVLFVNGEEIGRINLPGGPIHAQTFALQTVGNEEEGFYGRIRIPSKLLRPGQKNVLSVEVHQASAVSSDLFFDLALKVVPAAGAVGKGAVAAEEITSRYNKQHYLSPSVTIPDGYIDGGRQMSRDGGGHATSRRELLIVDRARDVELAADLAFARSPELRAVPPIERMQRLAARIDQRTTPPGGLRWVTKTAEQLEKEFANQQVLIGDWVDQCQAGLCRHRALLFKVLADAAGLRAALVRGNYAVTGSPSIPHAWNEVEFDDGRRVLVDVMHNGSRPQFPAVTDAQVVERYLRVDNTPWYAFKADQTNRPCGISIDAFDK